ncbi:type III-A CRISPR-associated protein Csm2 [Flammeovirga sp. SJP92]|uniref:type III-A CRISPR-associated protein Csm2 n=1 Tax=Flammeovirga sp. SJP92 TaxID=1775430 RepID=UPI000787562C|nr:type III-A CRISPR-associated protein Csm2 [Flammeovirga sp. SJP92]KXX69435.1 hypothetical protein AVL50_19350 [Flammeovirga sp. SJP92]
MSNINEIKSSWIKEGMDREAVKFAETLAKELVDLNDRGFTGRNAMTTSQVRNFFGEVRRIQMKGSNQNQSDFYMLQPKLAYAVARVGNRNAKINKFQEVTNQLLNFVDPKNVAEYDNLVSFLEAVVAYHKANNGK